MFVKAEIEIVNFELLNNVATGSEGGGEGGGDGGFDS